ncbi:unnamed protein product [Rotaria sp. Silwood2]|nr:unnamed protein product [Rotaria sp. Silwood2]
MSAFIQKTKPIVSCLMLLRQFFRCMNNKKNKEDFSIPLWEYNNQTYAWSQKSPYQNKTTIEWKYFRVLTYNIWFSKNYQPMRFNGLCDILNKSQAQIIGLQEMTKNILQQLIAQPFVQERYYVSDIDGRTFNDWYGVNEILRIGTIHLESLDNKQQRLCQLDICQKALTYSSGSYILMGDFNFSADDQENVDQFNRLPQWIDVWTSLMDSHNHGFTFDTETNLMIKSYCTKPERARYDRIILHSQTIIPVQINILGDQPVANEEQFQIFPSDHFGLTAVFQKKKIY